MEDARFYLRADHVNFFARLISSQDEYNLLTVGQLERMEPIRVQYRIEGIFLDGMPIDPNVQREIYRGKLLGINLDSLMPPDTKVAAFERRNVVCCLIFNSNFPTISPIWVMTKSSPKR